MKKATAVDHDSWRGLRRRIHRGQESYMEAGQLRAGQVEWSAPRGRARMRGLKEEGESCTDSAIQCYPLAGLAEFRREGSSGSYSMRRWRFERFLVADICRGMSLGVLCRVGLAFSRSTGPKGLPSNQSWASKIPSRYRPPQTEATRNGTGQKWAA